MLVIEVEFLTGVSVAASPYCREQAEWPPHPDRVFQALVAAWGRNAPPDDKERLALEWLEQLDADDLAVFAPSQKHRDVATVYVPPNDAATSGRTGARAPKELDAALRVVPEFRKNRQPRSFPAVLPSSKTMQVHYQWRLDEKQIRQFAKHRQCLETLAREVHYLGHSHTLVRMAVLDHLPNHATSDCDLRGTALRVAHPGRLKHLCDQFAKFQRNPIQAFRPRPSLDQRVVAPHDNGKLPQTVFDGTTPTVLVDAGGFVPALPAFPLVAKRLRDALLGCVPKGSPVPAVLSGHDAQRRPSTEPHMAIVPLADVGWAHSQGRLMGIAILWPRQTSPADRQIAISALTGFLRTESHTCGLLHFGAQGSWTLALNPDSERASCRFTRYLGPSRRWATVLPMVLDRYPKAKPGEELASIVAQSCVNIGLPKEAVEGLDVEVHKHATVRAAPSAPEVARCLPEDSPHRGRPLVHLVLTFAAPVRGPLILGAGRYRGLGLCLPLYGEDAK
mgnify:CR=1 FL=1